MTEEKKNFSAAESGSAPGGAFCDSPGRKPIPEEVPPWDTVRRTREMKPIARPTARVESSGEDRTEKHEAKSERSCPTL